MQNTPNVPGESEKELIRRRVIVLSDLRGKRKSDWFIEYGTIVKSDFEIIFYDCGELAEIDFSDLSEDKIHKYFNGHIEKSVKALLEMEKDGDDIPAFGVGGLLAWKTQFEGFRTERLFTDSRGIPDEKRHANCKINLYLAESDEYDPTEEWFTAVEIEMNVFKDPEHFFYSDKEVIIEVSRIRINQTNPNR